MKKKNITPKLEITQLHHQHQALVLRLIRALSKINLENELKIRSYLKEVDDIFFDIEVTVGLKKPHQLQEYDTSIPGGIVL